MNPKTILAINPGSRYIGFALFSGPDLRDWRVRSVPRKGSQIDLGLTGILVTLLITQLNVDTVVIKRLHSSRSSPQLNRLAEYIQATAKSLGMEIYQYSLGEMKQFFSPEKQIKSKKQLAGFLCSIYPALYPELQREREHKNRYYTRMFEAVGLGTMCFHQLEKQASSINS